jgi:2-keto-4-pentenoate hydratase/2-oxohepta-3-ene-1,7-dioic acid hydratase in catechol pathway
VKIARFGDWSTGIVVSGDRVVDIAASLPALAESTPEAAAVLRPLFSGPAATEWGPLIGAWDEARGPLGLLEQRAEQDEPDVVTYPLAEVTLLPPIPSPHATVFCAGANFADHAATAKSLILGRTVTEDEVSAEPEQGLPPWGFIALPRTIAAPGAPLVPPPGATMLDYEAEVAVILRSGGRGLDPDALPVWGFTAWNDVSVRDHIFGVGPALDRGILVWAISKNFDGANPCGPWAVVDEDYDVADLHMVTRVNGEVRQDSSTAKMVYTFGAIAAHLSTYVTLRPGDMLVSGTPAGTAVESGPDGPYLRPGDEVEITIADALVLRNKVVTA